VTERLSRRFLVPALIAILAAAAARSVAVQAINAIRGMPPVVDPSNLYSQAGAGMLSPKTAGALYRVYVPDLSSNDAYVIDRNRMQVVDRLRVGFKPQHVVPSWDLHTLWVTNNGRRGLDGTPTARIAAARGSFGSPASRLVLACASAANANVIANSPSRSARCSRTRICRFTSGSWRST
jgi:hypothetical protein